MCFGNSSSCALYRELLYFWAIGLGAWLVTVNIFSEASYIKRFMSDQVFANADFAMELGNIPCFFLICLAPRILRQRRGLITCVLLSSVVAVGIFLAFQWNNQTMLLISSFIGGTVGSCSMVTFFEFASSYRSRRRRRYTMKENNNESNPRQLPLFNDQDQEHHEKTEDGKPAQSEDKGE